MAIVKTLPATWTDEDRGCRLMRSSNGSLTFLVMSTEEASNGRKYSLGDIRNVKLVELENVRDFLTELLKNEDLDA